MVTLILDGEKMGKRLSVVEWEALKELVELYNKKGFATVKVKILAVMKKDTKETRAKEEREAAELKGKKKLVQKEIKKEVKKDKEKIDLALTLKERILSGGIAEEELEELSQLINKNRKVKQEKAQTGYKRPGEY